MWGGRKVSLQRGVRETKKKWRNHETKCLESGREGTRASDGSSLGQDDLLSHFPRWERVHVDGDQAIQSGVLLVTAAVQYSSHPPHVAAPTGTDGIKKPTKILKTG